MKILKYFFSIILYTYGLIVFAIMLIIMMFFTLFFKAEVWDSWFKAMLKLLFKVLFIKVKVKGKENIEKGKAYIFMPNHVSFLDIPLVAAFVPTFFRGIEAHHHFKWPIYGWATKRYGNIPINRAHVGKSMESYKAFKDYINKGKSVLVFPESTRTKDGRLQQFKKLPFYIAQQTSADIIPVGISGMYGLNPNSGLLIDTREVLKISFGKPISASKVKELSTKELTSLVESEVKKLIERP